MVLTELPFNKKFLKKRLLEFSLKTIEKRQLPNQHGEVKQKKTEKEIEKTKKLKNISNSKTFPLCFLLLLIIFACNVIYFVFSFDAYFF